VLAGVQAAFRQPALVGRCVFTQTQLVEQRNAVRDYESTSYVDSFQTASEFGAVIRAEALPRGLGRPRRGGFIGDGAAWIWELARINFPDALQILDLFHVLERLHPLCDRLYGVGRGIPEGLPLTC